MVFALFLLRIYLLEFLLGFFGKPNNAEPAGLGAHFAVFDEALSNVV